MERLGSILKWVIAVSYQILAYLSRTIILSSHTYRPAKTWTKFPSH